MLKYLSSIWNEDLLNNVNNLTPIIPILLYHGKPEWNSNNNMEMCFDEYLEKELKVFIPQLNYVLFDLSKIKDNELKGSIEYIIAMRTLKHIFEDILSQLREILLILEKYVQTKPISNELKDFLETFINYINKSDDIEPENIDELVETVSNNELKEVMMTLEQKLEKRGFEKGIEKGRLNTIKALYEKGIISRKIYEEEISKIKDEIEKNNKTHK
jgi:hypothetical protein